MKEIIRCDWNRDYVGCLGDFNPRDKICTRACALALRCIVEYNKRMDLVDFEDLFYTDDTDYIRIN